MNFDKNCNFKTIEFLYFGVKIQLFFKSKLKLEIIGHLEEIEFLDKKLYFDPVCESISSEPIPYFLSQKPLKPSKDDRKTLHVCFFSHKFYCVDRSFPSISHWEWTLLFNHIFFIMIDDDSLSKKKVNDFYLY